jgi:hypothetical protein
VQKNKVLITTTTEKNKYRGGIFWLKCLVVILLTDPLLPLALPPPLAATLQKCRARTCRRWCRR